MMKLLSAAKVGPVEDDPGDEDEEEKRRFSKERKVPGVSLSSSSSNEGKPGSGVVPREEKTGIASPPSSSSGKTSTVKDEADWLRSELLRDVGALQQERESYFSPPQELLPSLKREIKNDFAPTVALSPAAGESPVGAFSGNEEEDETCLPLELIQAQAPLSHSPQDQMEEEKREKEQKKRRLFSLFRFSDARLRRLAGILEDDSFTLRIYSRKTYLYVMGQYPRHNLPRKVVVELAALKFFSSRRWDGLFLFFSSLWLATIAMASLSSSPSVFSPLIAMEMALSFLSLLSPVCMAPVLQRNSSPDVWEEASLFLSTDWGIFFIASVLTAGFRRTPTREVQRRETEVVIEELKRVNRFLTEQVRAQKSYNLKAKLLSAAQRGSRALEAVEKAREALEDRPTDEEVAHGGHLRAVAGSILFLLLSCNLSLFFAFSLERESPVSLSKPVRQLLASLLSLAGLAIALSQCLDVWRKLRKRLMPAAEMSIKWQGLSRKKVLFQRGLVLGLLLTPSLALFGGGLRLAIVLGRDRATPAASATAGLYVSLFLTAALLALSRKGGLLSAAVFLLSLSPLMGFVALVGHVVDGEGVSALALCSVLLLQLGVVALLKGKLHVLWRLTDS